MIRSVLLAIGFVGKYFFKLIVIIFKASRWYCKETSEIVKAYPKKNVKIRREGEIL